MQKKSKFRVKVLKDGPYIVSGNPPMSRQIIVPDENGNLLKWKQGGKMPHDESCALCRCGKSKNKPFCDGTHLDIKFSDKK